MTPLSQADLAWARARAIWARQLAASRALDTVVKRFDRAGIDTLAVKGVVTTHTLYREPTERPMADADVRIRPEDFERAARVARGEAGWRIEEWRPGYGALVLRLEGLSVTVDVESVIGAPGLCALSIGEMLSRATRGVGGIDVRVPELHDHAVLMSVNVFKDKFALAAPWALEDARRIVEAEGFDADRFVDRARCAKIAGIAWIVADWMVRQRGSGPWGGIRERLGGRRAPRPLYASAFRALQERAPGAVATRVLARLGADEPRMWLGAMTQAMRLEAARAVARVPASGFGRSRDRPGQLPPGE
jgi:hypothetical protein